MRPDARVDRLYRELSKGGVHQFDQLLRAVWRGAPRGKGSLYMIVNKANNHLPDGVVIRAKRRQGYYCNKPDVLASYLRGSL